MISFELYVKNYSNRKNPATDKVWTLDEIAAETGTGKTVITEWFNIVRNTNLLMLENEGRAATDDELINAYELIHPGQDAIATPWGVVYKPREETKITVRTLDKLTVDEFRALMNDILDQRKTL